MKIILERWRQYVNEELLNEVPLEDFGYVDRGLGSKSSRESSSVGYEKSQDPAYKDKVVKFFDKTRDPWYIIFLKTTPDLPKNFEKIGEDGESGIFKKIKQMQEENNWNPNGKYIVVSFRSFSGDMSSPDWQIVHDVIGHTIEEYHRHSYGTWHKVRYNRDYKRALRDVHSALPKEMQIAAAPEVELDPTGEDRGPDIYAAIFFGKGPAIEQVPEYSQWLLKALQEVVDNFKDKIKEGEFWSFGGWG